MSQEVKKLLSFILSCIIITAISGCSGSTTSSTSESSILPEASQNTSEENVNKGISEFPKNAKVSYLGPQGTYTEEATLFFFGDDTVMLPEVTVEEAIEDVLSETSDYAVIPQENTIGGAVTNYVDALLSCDDVYIVGEVVLPISQTLLGVPGASLNDIKIVYSHAQGIKQSEQWRKENLPDAVTEETDSTAAAAAYVAESNDRSFAAIAAPGAAKLYGLEVLAENVQITDANKTRFYVLSKKPQDNFAHTKAVFAACLTADKIDDVIVEIHNSGLELVTIHDRPEGSMLGKYNYIIETENENGISSSITDKIASLEGVRFLGCFDAVLRNH